MKTKYFINDNNYKIRYNKKTGHFSLIIGLEEGKYKFLTLTHSKKYKRKNNFPLLFNPNKKDKNYSFVIKQVRTSKITNFVKEEKNKSLNVLDKVMIDLNIIEPYIKKQINKAKTKAEQVKELLKNKRGS